MFHPKINLILKIIVIMKQMINHLQKLMLPFKAKKDLLLDPHIVASIKLLLINKLIII